MLVVALDPPSQPRTPNLTAVIGTWTLAKLRDNRVSVQYGAKRCQSTSWTLQTSQHNSCMTSKKRQWAPKGETWRVIHGSQQQTGRELLSCSSRELCSTAFLESRNNLVMIPLTLEGRERVSTRWNCKLLFLPCQLPLGGAEIYGCFGVPCFRQRQTKSAWERAPLYHAAVTLQPLNAGMIVKRYPYMKVF